MQRRLVLSSVMRHGASALLVLAAIGAPGHSSAGDRELTESTDFRVRVQAALRLGRGGAGARADLEQGLRDTHPAVRVASAVGLGSIGDPASIPALQQAMKAESFASAKSSMNDTIEKLRAGSAAAGGSNPRTSVEKAKYIVQLGAMRNTTGQRADIDSLMRSAARAKAGSIKDAMVLDSPDAAVLQRASERKIPVLLVDGSLSRLTQTTAKGGGVVISAQVDFLIRRVPEQTLRGMVSGNASASDDARNANKGVAELQNRAVNGAVESAMSSVGTEIAALAK